MEIRVSDVRVNVSVPPIAREESARRTDVAESEKVVTASGASGDFSVAVEFRDFAAVIEALMNETRPLIVTRRAKLMPNKPSVSSSSPSSLGARRRTAHLRHGTTIVTHEGNRDTSTCRFPGPR